MPASPTVLMTAQLPRSLQTSRGLSTLQQALAQAGVNASLSFGLEAGQYAAHLPGECLQHFLKAFNARIPDLTGIEVEDTRPGKHLSTHWCGKQG